MINYKFIDNEADLEKVSAKFEGEKNIAVDLEADSMFHFREKVCLIQMASKNLTAIVDPLKIKDMSSLKPVFSNPEIRKIFHGSDYDVRSLHRDYGFDIHNLFDTELASRFLGVTETGLSSVLENRFDIKLDKSFQKKDWSKRPLPQEMIEYGAYDVIHLLPLAEILDSELKKKKRTDWVKEECYLLSRVRVPTPNGDPLFLKFKGAGRLERRSLGTLELLLKLRIKIAEKKDKPLFKVLSNSTLLELSKTRPTTLEKLKNTKGISAKQAEIIGKDLLSEINRAKKIPESELPFYPRKKKRAVKPIVPKRVQKLKDWRDETAEALELDPPILLNKSLLSAIAEKNPRAACDLDSIPGMKNWQKKEFGKIIIEILENTK